MLIGNRIKEARIKKGYSQELVGKIIGVSKVSVSGYEKGKKTPTVEKLDLLIDALDIDANYLLGKEVMAVSDDNKKYIVKIARDDLKIIRELKKKKELYNVLCSNTTRMIENIDRNITKEYE